ncbi:MAG: ABC transporter substrate-binding protein [Pseudomonadota bacterium]
MTRVPAIALRLLCTAALLLSAVQLRGAEESPQRVVESASEEILKILDERREELEADPAALYAAVDSVLLPRFDLVYAGRVVLGKHGRDASPEQRRRFIDAFYRSLVRTYASGLLEFKAENLRMLPYRGEEGATKTRVRTEVILDDGRVIPVDYTLRNRDGVWKVYDVAVEGISYLTNYRKEVDSLVRAEGLDAVIVDLETRNENATQGDG